MLGNDVAGVGNATSGSITDKLTRAHRMTLDEAHLILNVKRGEEIETVLKVSLFLIHPEGLESEHATYILEL